MHFLIFYYFHMWGVLINTVIIANKSKGISWEHNISIPFTELKLARAYHFNWCEQSH